MRALLAAVAAVALLALAEEIASQTKTPPAPKAGTTTGAIGPVVHAVYDRQWKQPSGTVVYVLRSAVGRVVAMKTETDEWSQHPRLVFSVEWAESFVRRADGTVIHRTTPIVEPGVVFWAVERAR